MKTFLACLAMLALTVVLQSADGNEVSNFTELLTGVPGKIVADAVTTPGFASVVLHGTLKEKHAWAKGNPTQYGHMTYDADDYLRDQKGWSEVHIHNVGHFWGFSPLWGNR